MSKYRILPEDIVRYSGVCGVCGSAVSLITPAWVRNKSMPCLVCGFKLSIATERELLLEGGKWLKLSLTD